MLDEGYQAARGKSHELHEAGIADGFWSRLTDSLDILFAGTEIDVDFTRETDGFILSNELKTAVLMIVKEAVTNEIKHSKATRVEILVYCDLNALVLKVTDNGQGIGHHHKQGIGLGSIRQRVQSLNGKVEWSAEKLGGKALKAVIPWLFSNWTMIR